MKSSGRASAASLTALFTRTVEAHGSRVALSTAKWQATYHELNDIANLLAQALLHRGSAPGDRVAILMRHDAPMIVAMVSVLKARCTVVMLNPTEPPVRLGQLIKDAEPCLIVADRAHRNLAKEIAEPRCGILCFEDCTTQGPSVEPDFPAAANDTAFLVYTSGSTGRPKGVMQPHQQVIQNAFKHASAMGLHAEDRVALFASLSGSQGVGTCWSALASGCTLCPFPTVERGVTGLAAWMTEHRISVYISSASLFRHFMKTLNDGTILSHVRVVRVASETATSDDFKAFRRHFPTTCALIHTLSSSETGNIAHVRLSWSDKVADGRLPVGRPSEGMEILVLDESGCDVRRGEIGHIVIRSRYLAAGYWRNEPLTVERFTECADGNRIFYSGDLGRINQDGLLEFMGRRDTKVKIRGFRVEPSDVEQALLGLPDVERAVVSAVERPTGEPELTAYVILRNGRWSTAAMLRRALRLLLPDHMIPSALILVDHFPLTPHGKMDWVRLAQTNSSYGSNKPDEQPRTETEHALADIWAEVFNSRDLGRHDDFFELGGDSLRAAVVAARVYDAFGVELNLGTFADHPTLADFALTIDKVHRAGIARDTPMLVPAARDTLRPLSLFQERIWNYSQKPQSAAGYIMGMTHHIRGKVNVDVLRDCMNYLAGRHEILRTTFAVVNGTPVQVVHPDAPVALQFLDLSGTTDAKAQAMRFFRDETDRIDLTKLPLLRFYLIKLRENEYWLRRSHHHIIFDGWCRAIYFDELGRLYEAKLNGDAPPLEEVAPLQYGDYAVWQRTALRPDQSTYRECVGWWKDILSAAPPPLRLPFRRSQPLTDVDIADGFFRWGCDPEIAQRLDELARRAGASYFTVRLATFLTLLAAESGEPDIVIGTYIANRNRRTTQSMLGLMTNLVTMRFRCNPKKAFRDWLSTVKQTIFDIGARSDIPYEELCRELRAHGVEPPEIHAIFQMTADHRTKRFADLEIRLIERSPTAMPWGFSVSLDEANDRDGCAASFDAHIHDPWKVRSFIDRYCRLLGAVSREPELTMGELLAKTPAILTPQRKLRSSE